MNKQAMTLKLPREVHKPLKQLAAAREIPMYALIAKMLLIEIENYDEQPESFAETTNNANQVCRPHALS